MHVAIVLPAHNEEAHLSSQIDAILDQDFAGDWELVVVDNNSSDGTAPLVIEYAKSSPRVRLVGAPEASDKSYAVGVGVASTDADLLVVCDADDIVAPGWLPALVNGLDHHQVVTGPNELDRLNPRWLAGSRGRSGVDPNGSFAGIFPCIRGNNFGFRRSVWDSVGPLRPGYYPVEDIEFSLRCWLSGIDVVGLPDAVVHYRYRDDARSLWRQGFAYGSHRPVIAALLRDAGKPTPLKFSGWRSWVMLIVKLPTLVSRSGRATWIWIAGNRLGQVVGSIRNRIIML